MLYLISEMLLVEEAALQAQIDGRECEHPSSRPEDRMNEVIMRLTEIDAHSAESRAGLVLSGLGFTPQMYGIQTRSLSGGWRMRYVH